jgi:hypothetical protein
MIYSVQTSHCGSNGVGLVIIRRILVPPRKLLCNHEPLQPIQTCAVTADSIMPLRPILQRFTNFMIYSVQASHCGSSDVGLHEPLQPIQNRAVTAHSTALH